MGVFSHSPDPDDAEQEFSTTPTRRISTPASRRLTAITEDSKVARPDVPQRNPDRAGIGIALSTAPPATPPTPRWSNRMTSRFSEDTVHPAPSYEWVNNPSEDSALSSTDDEKLAAIRSGRKFGSRGGWGRILLILAVILLIAIALGVGLGVGLNVEKHSSNSSSSSSAGSGTTSPSATAASSAAFPVGTFDIDTELRTVKKACASDPDTWTCYGGLDNPLSFEWVIANTSASYASENTTLTTSAKGVPANLTISNTGDPFTISFSNQTMTYIAPSSNASAARLEFGFTMDKIVYLTTLSGIDGSEAECYFNSTTFLASLYLSKATEVSSGSSSTKWPYAINFTQSAVGGSNVPNCYDTVTGARVNVTTESSSDTCVCDYRNF